MKAIDKPLSLAQTLHIYQKSENGGQGIETVRSICSYLRNLDFDNALLCWRENGDKLRQYPQIYSLLLERFGCQASSEKNDK